MRTLAIIATEPLTKVRRKTLLATKRRHDKRELERAERAWRFEQEALDPFVLKQRADQQVLMRENEEKRLLAEQAAEHLLNEKLFSLESFEPEQNNSEDETPDNDPDDELECYKYDPIKPDSPEVWVTAMCRQSCLENPDVRQVLEASQQVFIPRLAAFLHAQGVNVTRIYNCIRLRRSRDRIKEEFLDGRGNQDERRLYNTLCNCLRAGHRMQIVQRGIDGITDRTSLMSWLLY